MIFWEVHMHIEYTAKPGEKWINPIIPEEAYCHVRDMEKSTLELIEYLPQVFAWGHWVTFRKNSFKPKFHPGTSKLQKRNVISATSTCGTGIRVYCSGLRSGPRCYVKRYGNCWTDPLGRMINHSWRILRIIYYLKFQWRLYQKRELPSNRPQVP
jgi:hypothetical protein